MTSWPFIVCSGGAIGLLLGLFGVGGSSIATPLLSLLGVRSLAAVASPLPATIPGAVLAAIPYVRRRESRPDTAAWTLVGAIPATVVGALLSRVVGGSALLVASGLVLLVIGLRSLRPITDSARLAGTLRRQNRSLVMVAGAGVGLFTGLLANGGGFLLMPAFLLVFGLRMREAVGTSLLVIAALSVPTMATHWALGHVDWGVSAWFALGMVPASVGGSQLAKRFTGSLLRKSFGWFLIVFGVGFTVYRVVEAFAH